MWKIFKWFLLKRKYDAAAACFYRMEREDWRYSFTQRNEQFDRVLSAFKALQAHEAT